MKPKKKVIRAWALWDGEGKPDELYETEQGALDDMGAYDSPPIQVEIRPIPKRRSK